MCTKWKTLHILKYRGMFQRVNKPRELQFQKDLKIYLRQGVRYIFALTVFKKIKILVMIDPDFLIQMV